MYPNDIPFDVCTKCDISTEELLVSLSNTTIVMVLFLEQFIPPNENKTLITNRDYRDVFMKRRMMRNHTLHLLHEIVSSNISRKDVKHNVHNILRSM